MLNFRNTTLFFFAILLVLNLTRFLGFSVGLYTIILVGLYITIPIILSFFPCTEYHHKPVICKGPGNKRQVAITFDDGPDPSVTPEVLRILARHGVKATFFLIGNKVAEKQDLARSIYREGHMIGNHSRSHSPYWSFLSPAKMALELKQTGKMIESATGIVPRFFRPPYGVINPMVHWALLREPMHVVAWNKRSLDTVTNDPEKVFARLIHKLKAGDIILLHDTSAVTLSILDRYLQTLREKGLEPVRLDDLLNEPAYV